MFPIFHCEQEYVYGRKPYVSYKYLFAYFGAKKLCHIAMFYINFKERNVCKQKVEVYYINVKR